jgi:V/A-type H+-transporting ATPase subunit K
MNLKKILIISLVTLVAIGFLVSGGLAAEENGEIVPEYRFLSMALAVGLPSLGSGIAVARASSAATAALTEKPELFGRTIVYVGMAEGIAIYGLLIAFLIWI